MKTVEHFLEVLIFNSRWLLAPFYVGLVVSVALLLVKFTQEFVHIVAHIVDFPESEVILAILTLVDVSLVGNLLLIIIFSGYENFVSKINTSGHEDRPDWMGKVDFSGLKVKLIASIVAISAIELLRSFVKIAIVPDDHTSTAQWTMADTKLAWKVGIHAMLVISGLGFALMDRIAEGATHARNGSGRPDLDAGSE
jgi:uncharacterized protein (TIGR00645 family)